MVHKRQETTSVQRIEVLQIQGTRKRGKKALKEVARRDFLPILQDFPASKTT